MALQEASQNHKLACAYLTFLVTVCSTCLLHEALTQLKQLTHTPDEICPFVLILFFSNLLQLFVGNTSSSVDISDISIRDLSMFHLLYYLMVSVLISTGFSTLTHTKFDYP